MEKNNKNNQEKDLPRHKKKAAALSYDVESTDVPILVSVGEGFIAEKIISKAEEHQVPIIEDSKLAHVLTQLSVGDEIPPELYAIVAQILVFVGELDQQFGNHKLNLSKLERELSHKLNR